jgi:hypothetical protein
MTRISGLTRAALVFALALAWTSTAKAGPILSWLFPDDGPTPSYSPLRYWAPAAGRVNDTFHGPKLSVYAPDRHPEIAPKFTTLRFPRPTADPAATIIEPPTPPPSSRFKYE